MRIQEFEICDARPTGGKAGHGKNKTSSIQIQQHYKGGYRIVHSIRYKVDATGARAKALRKAREMVLSGSVNYL